MYDLNEKTSYLTLYKCAWWVAFTGFLWAISGFFLPQYSVWLIFYFPFSWVLWIACAAFYKQGDNLTPLMSLWLIIDLGILIKDFAITRVAGDVANSQGADIVVLVTYFPVLLPLAFLLQLTGLGSALPIHQIELTLTPWLPGAFGSAVRNWILISLIAAFQSMLYLVTFVATKRAYRRLTFRSRAP